MNFRERARRGLKQPLTLLLAWALTACGGGGGTEATAQAAAAPAASAPTDATADKSHVLATGGEGSRLVKWRPGHYVTLMSSLAPDPAYMNEVIAEMVRHPVLRGAQIRYTWAELEPVRGQYDFSRIERDLALLAAADKRLFILLQTKSFSSTQSTLPAYLDTEATDGGTYQFVVGAYAGESDSTDGLGKNVKLWNTRVKSRLIALTNELGRRFNAHAALEGVALTETALGTPLVPITNTQTRTYFENLLQVNVGMRAAFPNTVTLQYTNYPKSMLPTFVPGLRDAGAGLGGPDVFLDDPGLASGVYPYYTQLAGQVPLGPAVQSENYIAREHGGAYDPPTVDELYRFARNELKANYIFWARRAYPNDNPYVNVLAYLTSSSFPKNASGGLASTCPTRYEGCKN